MYLYSLFFVQEMNQIFLFSVNEYQAVECLDLKFITFSSQFYWKIINIQYITVWIKVNNMMIILTYIMKWLPQDLVSIHHTYTIERKEKITFFFWRGLLGSTLLTIFLHIIQQCQVANILYSLISRRLKCVSGINQIAYQSVSSVTLRVWLFAIPWPITHQASLSITNSRSLPKLMSIKLVMTSNHLTLSRPLLLLPSIFPSIRVFSNESALHMRWPKYWSFSFSISPSQRKQWHPTPVFLPGKSHGWRSLEGYSPWGC